MIYAREAREIDLPLRKVRGDHGLESVEGAAVAQRDEAVTFLGADRPYEAVDSDPFLCDRGLQ